jgi:WD40 repeat protein
LGLALPCLAWAQIIDDKDEFMYVGTRTGDVMQVSLGPKLYRAGGPKPFIQMGVLCLQFTPRRDSLVAGGGDGSVNLLRLPSFKNVSRVQLQGAVTSLAVCPGGTGSKGSSFEAYAGTAAAHIYLVTYDGGRNAMSAALVQRSHFNRINDVAFPAHYSDLFCTASSNDIRVWALRDMRELLRIQVANAECELKDSVNQECLCCAFMPDGKTLLSGWADGRIRAYAPQTGKLQYTIVNAHHKMGAFAGSDNTVKVLTQPNR